MLSYHFGMDGRERRDIFVAVPSYNHASFIEKCLRSIFDQTVHPLKLLVIDDGSEDGSVAIIERVLKSCPFPAELIARENRGLCRTLNEALAQSTGTFFAYLGSDDIWLPRMLEEQSDLLSDETDAVLAFSNGYLIDDSDRIIDCSAEWPKLSVGNILESLLQGRLFLSAGVLYRRSALDKHGWNESSQLEDYELYLKLALDGRFAYNDKILCAWRQHGSNVSGNFHRMLSEWLSAQDRLSGLMPMSRHDLERRQKELKFGAVSGLARQGYRSEAFRLFYRNLTGARSASQLAGNALRLLMPHSVFELNRRRKQQLARKRYGHLKLVLNGDR
jgi:alpha-1,3-rhamnosyltransferase